MTLEKCQRCEREQRSDWNDDSLKERFVSAGLRAMDTTKEIFQFNSIVPDKLLHPKTMTHFLIERTIEIKKEEFARLLANFECTHEEGKCNCGDGVSGVLRKIKEQVEG